MALTKEEIAERLMEAALRGLKMTSAFRYQKAQVQKEILKEMKKMEQETKPLVDENGTGPFAY